MTIDVSYYKYKTNGAPREIRTPDPLVRSQVLYPAELWAHRFVWRILKFILRLVKPFYLFPY